jgi:pyruvate/2-oxoglutarate dehydrogenase complex dihydrolipoamide dehydrogenase (E3) component
MFELLYLSSYTKDRYMKYIIKVIGGGAGGLVSSIGAAELGAKVALVEANFLGGDCTMFGCVPSKALIRSANVAHAARKLVKFCCCPNL